MSIYILSLLSCRKAIALLIANNVNVYLYNNGARLPRGHQLHQLLMSKQQDSNITSAELRFVVSGPLCLRISGYCFEKKPTA
jgi:hypothetical protein